MPFFELHLQFLKLQSVKLEFSAVARKCGVNKLQNIPPERRKRLRERNQEVSVQLPRQKKF